jgi:hypothetical protein
MISSWRGMTMAPQSIVSLPSGGPCRKADAFCSRFGWFVVGLFVCLFARLFLCLFLFVLFLRPFVYLLCFFVGDW